VHSMMDRDVHADEARNVLVDVAPLGSANGGYSSRLYIGRRAAAGGQHVGHRGAVRHLARREFVARPSGGAKQQQ